MTDRLRNSDKVLMELEEKRLKFEEQQRCEERDFQLRMIKVAWGEIVCTLHNIIRTSHPTSPSSLYYSRPGSVNEY